VQAEAVRAIRPEENAAAIYATLFAAHHPDLFDSGLYEGDIDRETLTRAWRDVDFPEVKLWLQNHADAFALLAEAAKLPQCRFPLVTTQLQQDAQMLRNNLLKRWALALERAANNDFGEGRCAEAMDKIRILLRMAEHLYQQKMLLDMPRGLEIERMACNVMSRLIVEFEPAEEVLGEMEHWFLGLEETLEEDWVKVFDHEKLKIKHIAGLMYEVNEAGKVRCGRHSIDAFNRQFKMGLHAVRRWEHAPRLTGLFLWFTIPHRPEYAGQVIDRIFERYFTTMAAPGGQDALLRAVENLQLNYKGIIELAAWRTVNWVHPHRQQWSKRLTCRNASLVLIALKRHQRRNGDWPKTLDVVAEAVDFPIIVDPINGGRFAYHRSGDSFLLYSMGKNGIDEDGRNDPREGSDDLWIWPARVSMLGGAGPDAE